LSSRTGPVLVMIGEALGRRDVHAARASKMIFPPLQGEG
jgi:hypothetical protein